jgi:hypothetical protein
MRRCSLCLAWSVVLFVAAPTLAADAKADDKGTTEKLTPTAKFLAKLVRSNESNKTLTVELTQSVVVANPYDAARILYWRQRLLSAQTDRNPASRLRRTAEAENWIAYHQVRLYSRHDQHQNLDLQAVDEVQVRVLQLPPAFDDKGKPRKRTAAEEKELKGPDPKLPGYTASFSQLKPGQVVEITMGKGKVAGKSPGLESSSSSGKPPPDAKLMNLRPLVIMVVIVR